MAERRYCTHCGKDVRCKEEQQGNAIALICSVCDKRIATSYGHIVIQ